MNGTKQLNQQFKSHGHWTSFSIYEGGLRLEVFWKYLKKTSRYTFLGEGILQLSQK